MCTLPTKRVTKQILPSESPGGENLLEGLTFFCPKLAYQGFIWEAAKKKKNSRVIFDLQLVCGWGADLVLNGIQVKCDGRHQNYDVFLLSPWQLSSQQPFFFRLKTKRSWHSRSNRFVFSWHIPSWSNSFFDKINYPQRDPGLSIIKKESWDGNKEEESVIWWSILLFIFCPVNTIAVRAMSLSWCIN